MVQPRRALKDSTAGGIDPFGNSGNIRLSDGIRNMGLERVFLAQTLTGPELFSSSKCCLQFAWEPVSESILRNIWLNQLSRTINQVLYLWKWALTVKVPLWATHFLFAIFCGFITLVGSDGTNSSFELRPEYPFKLLDLTRFTHWKLNYSGSKGWALEHRNSGTSGSENSWRIWLWGDAGASEIGDGWWCFFLTKTTRSRDEVRDTWRRVKIDEK